MKYFLISLTLILSSCCDCYCSPMPKLRPMPDFEQNQPEGIRVPCKVYYCK